MAKRYVPKNLMAKTKVNCGKPKKSFVKTCIIA